MRKIFSIVLVIILGCFLCGCGDGQSVAPKDFEGLEISAKTVVFDGSEHRLEINGDVPDGTDVVWTNNGKRLPGAYNVSASLTCDGYRAATLHSVLTVSPATFSGLEFADIEVAFGEAYAPQLTGLAGGASAEITYYSGDDKLSSKPTAVGEYKMAAEVRLEGYETASLTANLSINCKRFNEKITLGDKSVEFGGDYEFLIANSDLIPGGAEVSAFAYYNRGGDTPLPAKPTAVGLYTVKATISLTGYATKTLTANLTIYASKVKSIAFTNLPLSPNLPEGFVWALGLQALPEAHEAVTYTFTSSDKSVATVDAKGEITAVAAGTAIIKAAVDGYEPEISDSYELTVFSDTRMAEDFESVFTLSGGAGNAGRGKVPFAAGVSNKNITLSLTQESNELPFGGSGTALKITQTGAIGYNTVEFAFGSVIAGEKYELRYSSRLISGAHPMIFQLSSGGELITINATNFGANAFHFTANETGMLTVKLAGNTDSDYVITLDNLAIERYDGYRLSMDNLVSKWGNTMVEDTAENGQFVASATQGNRQVNIQTVADLEPEAKTAAIAAGIQGKALCFLSNWESGLAYKKVEMSWTLPENLVVGDYTLTFKTALLNGAHSRLIGIKGSGQTESSKTVTADGIASITFTVTAETKTLILSVADGEMSNGSRLLMDSLNLTPAA